MSKKIKVEVECANCGVAFLKDKTEITRKKAQGAKHYCSFKCCGKAHHQHLIEYQDYAKLDPSNRRDEYTGLRCFIVRARKRGHECNITKEYLKHIWEEQKYKCAYTGINLILPNYHSVNDPLRTASLDRIDSSKGYIEGNVQFVSIAINMMKHSMSDEQTKTLIGLIRA